MPTRTHATHTCELPCDPQCANLACVSHLHGLPASGQLQLDVLLSQVASVFLSLQALLQGVLVAAEGQGNLREGRLQERPRLYTCSNGCKARLSYEHMVKEFRVSLIESFKLKISKVIFFLFF